MGYKLFHSFRMTVNGSGKLMRTVVCTVLLLHWKPLVLVVYPLGQDGEERMSFQFLHSFGAYFRYVPGHSQHESYGWNL